MIGGVGFELRVTLNGEIRHSGTFEDGEGHVCSEGGLEWAVVDVTRELVVEGLRGYLRQHFANAPVTDGRDPYTGSHVVHIVEGAERWTIELTERFLDAADIGPHGAVRLFNEWNVENHVRLLSGGAKLIIDSERLWRQPGSEGRHA